jgi:hypothetical protein
LLFSAPLIYLYLTYLAWWFRKRNIWVEKFL